MFMEEPDIKEVAQEDAEKLEFSETDKKQVIFYRLVFELGTSVLKYKAKYSAPSRVVVRPPLCCQLCCSRVAEFHDERLPQGGCFCSLFKVLCHILSSGLATCAWQLLYSLLHESL